MPSGFRAKATLRSLPYRNITTVERGQRMTGTTTASAANGPATVAAMRQRLAASNRHLRRHAAALQEAALRGESVPKLRRRVAAFRDAGERHLATEAVALAELDAEVRACRHARLRAVLERLERAAAYPVPDGARIRSLVEAWLVEQCVNAPETMPV